MKRLETKTEKNWMMVVAFITQGHESDVEGIKTCFQQVDADLERSESRGHFTIVWGKLTKANGITMTCNILGQFPFCKTHMFDINALLDGDTVEDNINDYCNELNAVFLMGN